MAQSALLKPNLHQTYPTVAYGKGVMLYDTEGREYLDGSSGAMTANLGHGLVDVSDAIARQATTVAFSYRTQFTNGPAEELARRLTELAPGDLDWAFFVSSGSEASEYAIRVAVNHWRELGQPDKVKVLGRHTSYHGMTMGALSMSGHAARRPDYGSLLHPFPVAPPAHRYRYGLPGESEEAYSARAAADFEKALVAEDPGTVAAIIAEPIVGAAGGALVPPQGYFSRLREICDRHGVLLIMDEVITGMGRAGTWFASSHEHVVPDIVLLGKGLSAGYAPMAAILLREHLVTAMWHGNGTAPFGHTFSGNPLGAATCLAVLDHMVREEVLRNVQDRARELEAGLRELAVRYPTVADVRGRGLLWGFEFVTDPNSQLAPEPAHQVSSVFVEMCRDEGLIVYPAGITPFNNAILIAPPLTISASEVRLLLEKLDRALTTMKPRWDRWQVTASAAVTP
ncbi:aspartate aminotransferase family protein [Citricoccus nitrophenolicus]